jgi:hypothetical protein
LSVHKHERARERERERETYSKQRVELAGMAYSLSSVPIMGEGRERTYSSHGARSVGKVGRASEDSLLTEGELGNSLVPSTDDLSDTDLGDLLSYVSTSRVRGRRGRTKGWPREREESKGFPLRRVPT